MNNQNQNSHLTAIERTSLSYPARIVLNKMKIIGKVLDFGCGVGKDVELLKHKGFDIVGYDPFYFPEFPTEKFDTILCFYVLNVLLPEEQAEVLMNISYLLKPNGKAYFAVRRDIQYEGFRIHKVHKKETYQCLIKLAYLSIFKNENCEIYEYEHYTTLNKGKADSSPFLIGEETRELIVETATVFSFYDKFPVSKGHSLIVPKRLVSNYFDLTLKEQTACWIVANKVKTILQEKHNPDGFNIGININENAGQTISHCHIHIIPRYKGDVENPRGGIRGVIPSKKSTNLKNDMDELVRSNKLQFEKSNFFIQIYKQENGYEYIKIIQNIGNDVKSSMLINPNNLDEIIDTLIRFRDEIALNQKIDDKYFIKEEDKKTIINTFLKGITIKDLSLQFRYKEDAIRDLLVKNEIEIIEGNDIKSNFYNKRKFWKRK